jgi:hypothetical protein
VIYNQVAEDLRRCCDALSARIDELKPALKWTAAALLSATRQTTPVRESDVLTASEVSKSIKDILDEADRVLAGTRTGAIRRPRQKRID